MGYLMVLLLFLLFHIFLNVAFIGFVSRFFYVALGMLIISRDSHIYMRKFGLHPHHVILVSFYIADSEHLLYEIHFTMTTFTVLAYEHFSLFPFTSSIGLPQSGQDFVEMLSCLYFLSLDLISETISFV